MAVAFNTEPSGSMDCRLEPNLLAKVETYKFAILIIASIGALAVGGVGLAGCLGVISDLSQLHTIIMMVGGGGVGTVLFIVGLIGSVKNRQNSSLQHGNSVSDYRSEKVIGAEQDQGWHIVPKHGMN